MTDPSKIKETHTQRAAFIYLRQSTPAQVEHNRESTARQYALADKACQLGWSKEQVVIIDEDLGLSGSSADKRSGFTRLTSEVALAHVGIVLGQSWSEFLRVHGAPEIARGVVERLPSGEGGPTLSWLPLDPIAGVAPLGHRVTRRGGEGWVLVGDAAGFLDPFTGEGLHRAIVSAELASEAIGAALEARDSRPLFAYDRAMRARFGAKDVVSRVVQAFLVRPPLFGYAARRLASRASVRETMGLVMGDLAPAGRALDPRYLAALLRP